MISVIVLTYNDPRRLRLCLHGLLQQTRSDFELVVVHDGGDRKINLPVYEEIRRLGREISELWLGPESAEFRAAAARNLGLRQVHGERVLFVDGDCILEPGVVAEHAAYGAEAVLVNGARNHLPESCLDWLEPEHFDQLDQHVVNRDFRYQFGGEFYGDLRVQLLRGDLIIPLSHPEQVWSFQLSVPTALARQIGGFNETFVGWGGEDREFATRINRVGTSLLGRFDLLSYHLNHPLRADKNTPRTRQARMHQSLRKLDPVRNGGPIPAPTDRWP